MSRSYKLAAVAGLAVLMLAIVFTGQALAQRGTPTPGGVMGGNNPMLGRNAGMMSNGTVTATVPGQNMMGGAAGRTMVPSTGVTGTLPYWMQGMMGGNGMIGNGMMGGSGMIGLGVMGGWSDPNAKPLHHRAGSGGRAEVHPEPAQ
jgi:hypothetical protein